MGECTCLCAFVRWRGRRGGAGEAQVVLNPLPCSLAGAFGASRHQLTLGSQVSEHTRSALYAVPNFNLDAGGGWHENVHTRTEFDKAYTFAAFHRIAQLLREHNPASQKARDLFEDHSLAFAFDRHHILFILIGGSGIHSVEELTFLVTDAANDSADGRAVHMHIKDAKKNADVEMRNSLEGGPANVGHLAIGGRDQQIGSVGDCTLGITEEPKEKGC